MELFEGQESFLKRSQEPSAEPAPKRKKLETDNVFLDSANIPLSDLPFALSPKLLGVLDQNDITELFPVQSQVIPAILSGHDVAVCAPTGSGKTLAYVVPVLHRLLDRVVRRLRCVVLLPTRDLAQQVAGVFEMLCKATPLHSEVLYGQLPLAQEQARLVSPGGHSLVDVLITTPGRLVEHLRSTPGFTLRHLQFLVVDEADRLQMQSFQGWLEKSFSAVAADSAQNGGAEALGVTASRKQNPLQKLLFSATLSQNPRKIANLQLRNPKFFTAAVGRYKVPDSLEEFYIKCEADEKASLLLWLLETGWRRVVCFTASVDSTHRLAVLMQRLSEKRKTFKVAEYSSGLSQEQRKACLQRFDSGKTDLLVCSDMMTRGMDLTTVQLVVNYDVPPFIKTYVHRVGRTARAGQKGSAVTLAQPKEMYHFKQNLAKADNSKLRRMKVDPGELVRLKAEVATQFPELKKTIMVEEGKTTFTETTDLLTALREQARLNFSGQ